MRNFKRQKQKLCKKKKLFCNADSDADVNPDADAEMPMTRFPNDLGRRCSENMQQIHRRILMPKCDFNKVAKQLY